MNNRQAALIAAASAHPNGKLETKGNGERDIMRRARIYELWLDELDQATEEQRMPVAFEVIQAAVTRGADLEREVGSMIERVRVLREQPYVTLANGHEYWHPGGIAGEWRPMEAGSPKAFGA